jgi:TRAP-type C4-dicarboxylate transport system substrate-binding protein
VNKRVWRKLDEQTRQAVLKAAEKAEKRGIEMSRKEAIENTKELQANGIKVYSHSEIQPLINELKKAGDELMQEWMSQGNPEYREVIEEYKALLK